MDHSFTFMELASFLPEGDQVWQPEHSPRDWNVCITIPYHIQQDTLPLVPANKLFIFLEQSIHLSGPVQHFSDVIEYV